MTRGKLISLVFDLNAALDSSQHDGVSIGDVAGAIEGETVIPWLKECAPDLDLSYLNDDDVAWYHDRTADMHNAYSGNERRKWGVENRGFCLLLAWTVELLKD